MCCTYLRCTRKEDRPVGPNPAPNLFPKCGKESIGFFYGYDNLESPFEEVSVENMLSIDKTEHSRYRAARNLKDDEFSLCRQFIATEDILNTAETWTSGGAAVGHFLAHTIKNTFGFYESKFRKRERKSVSSLVDNCISPASVASGTDIAWCELIKVPSGSLGRDDNWVSRAMAASELCIRLATIGTPRAGLDNDAEYERGGLEFDVELHKIDMVDFFGMGFTADRGPTAIKYKGMLYFTYMWNSERHGFILSRPHLEAEVPRQHKGYCAHLQDLRQASA